MANINTPAHDFAPPWLKIPTYDSNRPSGAESDRGRHASRKEGHNFDSSRYTKDSDNCASQRYNLYSDFRRERGNCDDSYFDGHGGHVAYNTNNGCNGTFDSSSQSALLRRPHSRHDFRNVPTSYAKGDTYNRHVINNGGGFYGKAKSKFADVNNSNGLFNENGGGINVSSNNFNQEFPSLQGDISEEPTTSAPAINGSVWEKHRSMTVHGNSLGKKIQLTKRQPFVADIAPDNSRKSLSVGTSVTLPSSSSIMNNSSSNLNSHTVTITPIAKSGGPGMYRALVPTKCNGNSKKSLAVKDVYPKVQTVLKKVPTSVATSASHSMEILVKHPKAPGNKSEFLKALRNENSNSDKAMKDSQENNTMPDFEHASVSSDERPHSNGIDIAKVSITDDEDGEKPLLSSSLEAEQRLLREMGWKEDASDEDNYAPLTEDEMKEFQALKEQISKKNGIHRNFQVNFSSHQFGFNSTKVTLPSDSSSSSSDSDSDF